MLNKFKIHVIKNSLENVARSIFEYLCGEGNSNSIQENKELAIKYSEMSIVKQHHIGKMYEIEALRYTLLNSTELTLLEKGMNIIDSFFEAQKKIDKEGYNILCSPLSMKNLLIECRTISEVEEVILILEKELLSLENNISKRNKEKYQSANPKQISTLNLNDSQKKSLNSLGFDGTKDIILTLATLKKMYNQKLYSVNYDKTKNATDEYIKELSDAFFNVKRAFEASC